MEKDIPLRYNISDFIHRKVVKMIEHVLQLTNNGDEGRETDVESYEATRGLSLNPQSAQNS